MNLWIVLWGILLPLQILKTGGEKGKLLVLLVDGLKIVY